MKRLTMLLSVCLVLGAIALVAARSDGGDNPKGTKIRIGTYDNRGISIAHFASRFNQVEDKKREYDKAKAAGDKAKAEEIEAWFAPYQRKLNFQTFGRAPVDDLLEPVKERVAKLACDKNLAAVTMSCDFTSEQVELVDITEDLVKLFHLLEPLEVTLKTVREIRKTKPVKLSELKENP